MSTILFESGVFGPVHSRRLGLSLGINLLPADRKVCSFDCLYCECGFTKHGLSTGSSLPTRKDVRDKLKRVLSDMQSRSERPDVITFAGNGEPTLHPDFRGIVDDVVELRDVFAPLARIAVLSNATMLKRNDVVEALCKVDEAILKIDSGLEKTVAMLDRPQGNYVLSDVVERIGALRERFGQRLVVQTMFTEWTDAEGRVHNNTSEEDVRPWIDILCYIRPPRVMIYTIDRETPLSNMKKISSEVLEAIGERVRSAVGCLVEVAG